MNRNTWKRILSIAMICILSLSGVAFAAAYTDKTTVAAVQEALNAKGYDCGTPDGIIGKRTTAAISAFQEAAGITVTGTITDELLTELGIDAEALANESSEGENTSATFKTTILDSLNKSVDEWMADEESRALGTMACLVDLTLSEAITGEEANYGISQRSFAGCTDSLFVVYAHLGERDVYVAYSVETRQGKFVFVETQTPPFDEMTMQVVATGGYEANTEDGLFAAYETLNNYLGA